jgi:fructose-1,6-bisphosphatase/inositol monophosphatase family enzyme
MNNYTRELEVAIELAQKAGEIMTSYFSMDIHTDWKADNTPLTKADTDINKMVIERIKESFPEHDVMGEEESSSINKKEYLWICDPIDGTIPYSHGLNTSVFSLALVKEGDPIVGILYDPFQKLLFKATINEGAFLNDKPIKVSTTKEFKKNIFIVDGDFNLSPITAEIEARYGLFMSYCSFLYGAKMIASGHFAGAVFTGTHPWDCAAAKIIIEEAGGKTSDLDGNPQRYDQDINGFVAGNEFIHGQLLEIINKTRNA